MEMQRYIRDDECNKLTNVMYVSPQLDNEKKRFKCMWCTLDIVDGLPMGCPLNALNRHQVDYKRVNIIPTTSYQTYGTFCSFNCAKAYAQSRYFDPKFKDSINLLAKMYVETYVEHVGPVNIVPSPPIELLCYYGGTMSEAQYKSVVGRKLFSVNSMVKMYPVTLSICEEEVIVS